MPCFRNRLHSGSVFKVPDGYQHRLHFERRDLTPSEQREQARMLMAFRRLRGTVRVERQLAVHLPVGVGRHERRRGAVARFLADVAESGPCRDTNSAWIVTPDRWAALLARPHACVLAEVRRLVPPASKQSWRPSSASPSVYAARSLWAGTMTSSKSTTAPAPMRRPNSARGAVTAISCTRQRIIFGIGSTPLTAARTPGAPAPACRSRPRPAGRPATR
jgi:hypothetical protein